MAAFEDALETGSLGDAIQSVPRVVLDVTHGPRHLALLAFATALYLSALGRCHLEAACYALLREDKPRPLVDLRPLLNLATLAFAADGLRQTGSTGPLVERLSADGSEQAEMLGAASGPLGGIRLSAPPQGLLGPHASGEPGAVARWQEAALARSPSTGSGSGQSVARQSGGPRGRGPSQ